MKKLLLLAFFVPVVGSAQTITLKETNHGLYTGKAVSSTDEKNSPTGSTTALVDVLFFPTTDTIPMEKGKQFGIQFILESNKTVEVDIEVVWIFPTVMVNNKGEKFAQYKHKTSRITNMKSFTGYHFDEPYEMLPGKWTLQIFHKKKMIHSHDFYIVAP